MTIKEIERAITNLPPKQLSRIRKWFYQFDAAVWDRQFEEDVKIGRIDAVARKAIADFRKGKFREL